MDLFDEKNLNKLSKDTGKLKDFVDGRLNIQVLSSSDPTTSYDSLLHVKYLFQRMLPKMPKEYILRQVFDENQYCMTLNEKIDGKDGVFRIIGAVLFRPSFQRKLIEIVFLAVDSDYHVSGYGTFLFNCFKEISKVYYSAFLKNRGNFKFRNTLISDLSIFDNLDSIDIQQLEFGGGIPEDSDNEKVKIPKIAENSSVSLYTNETNLYLLTYADNSAIGFFKKQGFSLRPRSAQWIGYIKDYEGGTLMECKIYKSINYLKKCELIKRAREIVFDKMKSVNEFHVLCDSSDRTEMKIKLEAENAEVMLQIRTKMEFLSDFLYFLICTLQSHPSAWPFLEPVAEKDVPDYFEVVKHPMDMSLIMEKLKRGEYSTLREFKDDIDLMCNNCFSYNNPETQYYKCAESIKNFFEGLLVKYTKTISDWGFELESMKFSECNF